MLDSTGRLSIAEMVVYAISLIPLLYCLVRHGKYGILGWIYLVVFCILRIVGSGLLISGEKKGSISTTALIINGVALSPLLLALDGILLEANCYIKGQKSPFLRAPIAIAMHFVISGAISLIAAGSSSNSEGNMSNPGLVKVGSIILVLVWLVLVALTAISWRYSRENVHATRLLVAATVALPFLGIRVIYSLVSRFDAAVNSSTGPLAVRVVLGTLMEFIIVIIFVIVGLVTRNISRQPTMNVEGSTKLNTLPNPQNRQRQAVGMRGFQEQKQRS